MFSSSSPLVILGAGAIGCYLGVHWMQAGVPVTLLGRAHVLRLRDSGVSTSTGAAYAPGGADERLEITDDDACLARAGMIVVCVKATALPAAIDQLRRMAPASCPIFCLLNGVAPLRDMRAALPDHMVLGGMVPFNVVWETDSHLRRSSVGQVVLERAPATQALAKATAHCPEPPALTREISAIQHGKLLLNLNNPVNALSGLSLYDQLRNRQFRRAYAAVLAEALEVYGAAGVAHAKSGPLPAHLIVRMLRTPDWLFNTVALRLQRLDPGSQTSMAQDLAQGKPTEIDSLNGEIIRIAQAAGRTAPKNAALVRLVKEAENGGRKTYDSAALLQALNV